MTTAPWLPALLLLNLLAVTLVGLALRRHARRSARQQLELREEIRHTADRLFIRLELDRSLRERLGLDRGLPYSHHWSAAPDFLHLLADHVPAARPRRIVECSSGLSTLVLARCCELAGVGEVVSLENGPDYARRTRAELERYGLAGRATVLDAPLVPTRVGGEEYRWYDTGGLDATPIDMLVIDGPPGFIQRLSRYPALAQLRSRLADGCTIFLDDAARPDERESVARWLAEERDLSHEYLATERGCSVLRLVRKGGED